jgi:hypothetical protein
MERNGTALPFIISEAKAYCSTHVTFQSAYVRSMGQKSWMFYGNTMFLGRVVSDKIDRQYKKLRDSYIEEERLIQI